MLEAKNILFMTYLHRHFVKIVPVHQELTRRCGRQSPWLLFTPPEWEEARRQGINLMRFEKFSQYERRGLFDWDWGLVALIAAITELNPRVLVMAEVNYFARHAARYCRLNGIKTLIIQHGFCPPHRNQAFIPLEADLMGLWGREDHERLVALGVDPQKLRITGAPCYEALLENSFDPRKTRKSLGLGANERFALFTTAQKDVATWRGFAEAAHELGLRAVFKVHPATDPGLVSDSLADLEAIVTKSHDPQELINAAEVMATIRSSTFYDALILKTKLFFIDLGGKHSAPRIGAPVATRADRIISSFREALSQDSLRVPENLLYKVDGKSSERIVDLIEELAASFNNRQHV